MANKNICTLRNLIALCCSFFLVSYHADAQACNINLLVAYTDDAADSIGGDYSMQLAIEQASNFLNIAYINSEVNHQISLVRTVKLSNTDESCFVNELNAFQADDYIYSLREKYHADIAVLIVANADYCGLSYYSNYLADDTTAYSAVNVFCMQTNFALNHQIGHLYGCWHATDASNLNDGSLYSYGHGFQWEYNDYASFTTIMGVEDDYFCGGADQEPCNVIPYFSNPNVSYSGVKLGDEGINDNARVLNTNAAHIGSIKTLPMQQLTLSDTVNLYTLARASAQQTLATGTGYQILDSASVQFQSGQKIELNPGFAVQEGAHFEAIIQTSKLYCGENN